MIVCCCLHVHFLLSFPHRLYWRRCYSCACVCVYLFFSFLTDLRAFALPTVPLALFQHTSQIETLKCPCAINQYNSCRLSFPSALNPQSSAHTPHTHTLCSKVNKHDAALVLFNASCNEVQNNDEPVQHGTAFLLHSAKSQSFLYL